MSKKINEYIQHDSMQCGITCLQIISDYYGKKYSIDYLSNICFASNQGVSLLGISDAAKKIGFKCSSVKASVSELETIKLPCILHWNQEHFVVLYKIKNGRYYLVDPANGKVKCNLHEFKRNWSNGNDEGIAMILEPSKEFYEKNDVYGSPSTESRSFRFLFGYLTNYKKRFGIIVLCLVVGCIMQLVLPFLTQAIVDVGIRDKRIDLIWLILVGQLVLTFSRTAVDFCRRWHMLHVSVKVNISLVSDFFVKLLQLPMSFFDTKLIGDLFQRISDHGRVNNFLTKTTLNISFSVVTFCVFSIVLLIYSRLIFFIFILGSFLYGCWIVFFLKKRKSLDYELFSKESKNQSVTYELISSMQEIKLQGCEQRKRKEWENVQNELFSVQVKSLKLQQLQEAGSVLINELKNIAITIIAATSVINDELTLGMMMAIQYIIGQLNSPVEQFMSFIYSLQDVNISLERINEIHNKEDENGKNGKLNSLGNELDGICIENVDFKYDPHSLSKTIDNVSLVIPKGKVTAIVGPSGSGKTTLIKLLLGYYSVLNGKIFVGGEDINSLDKKWWRGRCGVVMQDGVIFSDTIARNIAVEDEKVNEERLLKASEIARIKDYVMMLPHKFNTKIGRDGMGLSQGQKQRILIARAVYRNPDYIFLDEATNSLDAKNERDIVEGLDAFYKEKTVVVVAHRLSTVKNADQIVVVDGGKIVETGNHFSLVEKRGIYYNLVRNQLELGN